MKEGDIIDVDQGVNHKAKEDSDTSLLSEKGQYKRGRVIVKEIGMTLTKKGRHHVTLYRHKCMQLDD